MAMTLPTYNQSGWGATLNNYLRELNQRISKIEANSENSSNNNQIFGASVFNTGLTSTNGICIYDGEEKYSTFKIDKGFGELYFTCQYFITQTTAEGKAYLGSLNNKTLEGSISLNSNQTMLLCVDGKEELHIIPFIQEVGETYQELDYSLCRLGYITNINGTHIYFTPCPNIATMDLHDKYNYIMRPTYKSNDAEKPQIQVGSYSYMMEGLNYYQHVHNISNNQSPVQVLENESYNVHTFNNVVAYFLIQKNAKGEEVIVGEYSPEELENHINGSDRNKIFVFYVTIAGIIFVREILLKENEQIVDSTSLANFIVNTEFAKNNVLFYNYSWLKPLELKRCGKDPFGKLRWHMASYNGISPQIIGTPIHTVDTNYYWADNYLTQINNTDESLRNYYGLRIRPYIQLNKNGEEENSPSVIANQNKKNEYVVLNISGQPTPDEYKKASIVVGSSTNFYFNYTSSDNSIEIKNSLVDIDWNEGSITTERRMWQKTIDDCVCTFSVPDAISGEMEISLFQITKDGKYIKGTSLCTKNIITTLNPKTQPGIFLYNYKFTEPLSFGGLESSSDVVFGIRNTGLLTSGYHLFFNKAIEAPLRIEGNDESSITIYNNYLIGDSEGRHAQTLNLNWNTGIASFKAAQVEFSTNNSNALLIKNNIDNTEYYKLLTETSKWILLDKNINQKTYTYTGTQKLRIYFSSGYQENPNVPISYSTLSGFYEFHFPNTTSEQSPLTVSFSEEKCSVKFYYDDINQQFKILGFTPPPGAIGFSGVFFEKFEYYEEYFNHNFTGNMSIIGDTSISGNVNFMGDASISGNVNFMGDLIVSKSCFANEFKVTSDIRHKNIHGLFNFSGLNVIDNLPIYKYAFKATPSKETIGITAQDLLKVLPQLVDTSDESHYKINESKLVYVCMQAIKELNTKISTLEEEIKSLRGN